MEKSIKSLNLMFEQLKKGELVTFSDVKAMKKVMGVYIVFSEKNEMLYIGSTNNFNVRFGTDLRHESTHTLIKKLIKAEIHLDRVEAAFYFTNHYKYKIHICESKREAEALEHLAIWLLNPKYNSNPLSI